MLLTMSDKSLRIVSGKTQALLNLFGTYRLHSIYFHYKTNKQKKPNQKTPLIVQGISLILEECNWLARAVEEGTTARGYPCASSVLTWSSDPPPN